MKKTYLFITFSLAITIGLTSCNKESNSGENDIYYTVIFDYEGYEPVRVLKGEKIEKPVDPIKLDTEQYSYTFDAWYNSDTIWDFDNDVVVSDLTLSPVFIRRDQKYVISFVSEGVTLQSNEYNYGALPVYTGETPLKNDDGDCTYTFDGWDHEIESVTKNDTYVAVFKSKEKKFEFVDMEDTYYPYIDAAKNYLQASNPDVHDYVGGGITNQAKPITIKWVNDYSDITSLKCIYSLNDDYSDSVEIELDSAATSVNIYNLYKASTYYLKVIMISSGNEKVITTSFKTADLGPRVMNIEGIYNTRDVGGYLTSSGKRTVQGLFYRGGALSKSTDVAYDKYVNLTEESASYMKDVLKIKSDLDLRTSTENLGLEESPIPGASLSYFNLGGYLSAFTGSNAYKNVFKALSRKANYPLYIHCTGGADRTGTVCFIANALLGVLEEDLIHDYEFTSFSIYGERNSKEGTTYPFYDFLSKFKSDYKGDSLSEKANDYLLSIGLTQLEIDNFKAIMFGEEVNNSIDCKSSFDLNSSDKFEITLGFYEVVTKLTIDGNEIPFTQDDTSIFVDSDVLNSFVGENRKLVVEMSDGKKYEKIVSFIKDMVIDADDCFDFKGNDSLTISGLTRGTNAVGYGNTFKVRMKTNCGSNGGIYVLIGSYGIYLRGAEFRTAKMANGGTPSESERYLGMGCSNTIFNNGDTDLYLKVTPSSDSVSIEIRVVKGEKEIYSYNYSSAAWKLKEGEIASENAVPAISFVSGDANGGSSLTIYKNN